MNNKSRQKKIPLTANRTKLSSKETSSILPQIKPPASNKTNTGMIKREGSTEKVMKAKNINTEYARRTTNSKTFQKQKQMSKQKMGWNRLPLNILLDISLFCCSLPFQVYKLSLTCSIWRQLMSCENAKYFWIHFKQSENARNFAQFKISLQKQLAEQREKMSVNFETMFTKLFNYGSTKENIPNKLITKLNLDLSISINKQQLKIYPFKLRNFNFSSYVYTKVTQLQNVPFDLYTPHNLFKDNLNISIKFYSKTYKVGHTITYKFCPEEIADCAIRQKAFNYFINKNIIITYFQGDNNFLYFFFQISALELILQFRKQIKANHQAFIEKKTKKVPMYKKLCETQFQDFMQYLKFQADFELHLSYHNSVKQIFTHCDTKVYPLEYDNKHAYFQVKIDDSFDSASTFKLDNKMGMSQNIEDLYLLDFVLKDRDRFLIAFSGFVYARNANQKQRQSVENYFQFAEKQMKLLEFKSQKYNFSILIIEEGKRNFIKHTKFNIYP